MNTRLPDFRPTRRKVEHDWPLYVVSAIVFAFFLTALEYAWEAMHIGY